MDPLRVKVRREFLCADVVEIRRGGNAAIAQKAVTSDCELGGRETAGQEGPAYVIP
jgi:hypothetical protein